MKPEPVPPVAVISSSKGVANNEAVTVVAEFGSVFRSSKFPVQDILIKANPVIRICESAFIL
jgi:hypothetical protein